MMTLKPTSDHDVEAYFWPRRRGQLLITTLRPTSDHDAEATSDHDVEVTSDHDAASDNHWCCDQVSESSARPAFDHDTEATF